MPVDPNNVDDDVLESAVENLEQLSEEEQEALLESEQIRSRVEEQQELKERREDLEEGIMTNLADDEGWLFNPDAKETEMNALLNTGRFRAYQDQQEFDPDAEGVEAETEQGRTFPLEEPGRVDNTSDYSTREQDAFVDRIIERGEFLSAAEIGSRLGADPDKVKEAFQGAIDKYREEGKTFEALKAARRAMDIKRRVKDQDEDADFELDDGYGKKEVAADLAEEEEGNYVDPGVDTDEDEAMGEQIKEEVGKAMTRDAGYVTGRDRKMERALRDAKAAGRYREAIALSEKFMQAADLEFAEEGEESEYDEAETEYRPDKLVKEAAETYWNTIQDDSVDEEETNRAYRNLAEINGMLGEETVQKLDQDTQSKLLIASQYVENKMEQEQQEPSYDHEEPIGPEPPEEADDYDTSAESPPADEGYQEQEEEDSGGFFSSLLGG
jgi:hypothetical protein